MSKRLFLVLILLFAPLAAAADDTASSSGLGPQTAADGTASSGGSNADSVSLQPAGNSPLQSTTNDSTGLTAPSSVLQAPVTSDANLKVLAGESDGAPQDPANTGDSSWIWLGFTLLIAVITGGSVLLYDRRRFLEHERTHY